MKKENSLLKGKYSLRFRYYIHIQYTHIHTYIHACMHAYIHVHAYIHTYIHTYMYLHTYIHTHSYKLAMESKKERQAKDGSTKFGPKVKFQAGSKQVHLW